VKGLRLTQRVAPALLCCAAALYIASLYYARSRPARPTAAAGLPAPGQTVPPLTGYTLFGARIAPTPRGHCALIHYISGGCGSCSVEASAFATAARLAITHACAVWTIAASAARPARVFQLDTVGNAPLVYIPYAWSAAVPLRATPTTMLLDRNRRVIWLRVGALDAASASSLIDAIEALPAE